MADFGHIPKDVLQALRSRAPLAEHPSLGIALRLIDLVYAERAAMNETDTPTDKAEYEGLQQRIDALYAEIDKLENEVALINLKQRAIHQEHRAKATTALFVGFQEWDSQLLQAGIDVAAEAEQIADRVHALRGTSPAPTFLTLDDLQKAYVLRILNMCHGNKSLAARTLGMSRSALRRLVERYISEPIEPKAQ